MFIEKAEIGQTGLKCSMWGIIKSYKLYMEEARCDGPLDKHSRHSLSKIRLETWI